MENIDLTLRADFIKVPDRRRMFDNDIQYDDKMGHKDQRRARLEILGDDPFTGIFGIKFLENFSHLKFFGDEENTSWEELKGHEDILRITNILTNALKLEYDAGYGNENLCDCCGGFKSHILNSQQYGLCDNCEKYSKYRNEKFWERKETLFEETWID